MQHIFFFYISLPLFCTTTTWNFQKLLSLDALWRKCRTCSRTLFSLSLIFTFHWWPLAFLILSPPLQKFHVVLPTERCLVYFFISRSKSLSPFFSLSFAGLPPTFSFSLSFSCSIFQICGYDNTDTETISAFRFRLYWLFCCLCFTRGGWLCDFPPK